MGQLAPHGFQHAVDRSPVRLIRFIAIIFEPVEDRERAFDTQNVDRLGPSHSLDAKYGLTAYKFMPLGDLVQLRIHPLLGQLGQIPGLSGLRG
jgi:hypothetical protein